MSAEKALSQISLFQFHPVTSTIILAFLITAIVVIVAMTTSIHSSIAIAFPICLVLGLTFAYSAIKLSPQQVRDLKSTPTKIVSTKTITLQKVSYSGKTSYFEKPKSKISYFINQNGHLTTKTVPSSANVKFLKSKNPNQPNAVLTIQTLKYQNKDVIRLLKIKDEPITKQNYIFVEPQ